MPVVEKSVLMEALRRVSLAVSDVSGTYSPDSIQSDGEYLYGFNEVVGVKVQAPWLAEQRFSVHGPTLVKAVRACSTEAVSFGVTGNELSIVGGNTKAKIKLLEDRVKERYGNIYPHDPDWKPFPDIAVATKPVTFRSPFKFSGAFFSGESIYAADAGFAIRSIVDAAMEDLWLSTSHVQIASSFGGIDSVIVRSSWAHFASGDSTISVRRLIESNYPAKVVKSLFDREPALGIKTALTPELISAIKSSIPFADAVDGGVLNGTISFCSNKLVISTTTKGSEFEEVVYQPCTVVEQEDIKLDLKAFSRCVRYMGEGEMFLVGGKRKRLFMASGNIEAAISID